MYSYYIEKNPKKKHEENTLTNNGKNKKTYNYCRKLQHRDKLYWNRTSDLEDMMRSIEGMHTLNDKPMLKIKFHDIRWVVTHFLFVFPRPHMSTIHKESG